MELKEAFAIMYDLAIGNALIPKDVEQEPDLYGEFMRQQEAFTFFDTFMKQFKE